jgi:hypothetical protein
MTIDRVVANLYTCCKCKHQRTRWNGNDKGNDDREVEQTITITTTMPLTRRTLLLLHRKISRLLHMVTWSLTSYVDILDAGRKLFMIIYMNSTHDTCAQKSG